MRVPVGDSGSVAGVGSTGVSATSASSTVGSTGVSSTISASFSTTTGVSVVLSLSTFLVVVGAVVVGVVAVGGVSATGSGTTTSFKDNFLTFGATSSGTSAGFVAFSTFGVGSAGVATTSSATSATSSAGFATALMTLIARFGAISVFGKYLLRTFSAISNGTLLDATLTSAPSRRRSSITRFVSCFTSRARS